ncbi:DUF2934 domain-containing protein [Paraburkholderia hospita]|nr:DUF2934 domain-containing protein [Paraburkholderia hospita]
MDTGSEGTRLERIRDLAYRLWEQDGSPDDHTDQYWYEAERQIRTEGGEENGEASSEPADGQAETLRDDPMRQ